MDKELLINDNMPIVKHLAHRFFVPGKGMEYSDLVNSGVIGLMEAIDKFDEAKGAKFSSYAYIKIKSYILDEIRKQQPISKYSMSKIKNYNESIEVLTHKLNRKPSIEEKCERMNISKKELFDIEYDLQKLITVSLDKKVHESAEETIGDALKSNDTDIPSNIVEETEKVEILSNAIKTLKEKEQIILSLYYYEELNLKEIGSILDVSESRVSQLHKKAINSLKKNLEDIFKYPLD